ncbi:hypothetical protein PDESU_01512 [Pontiella desulfatans]|uniref:CHAD domain-containing protein n=1 Tax=Pontiella desulfatans TaxID=2750659 RepID=A0A6C2TZ16_PONDE|nr:CHAD domain-containing protein [Pontiella desulfatans]VGO12958.1 hypothetical protein PDESU_01512 [Pontiella desulfatans]
MKNIAFAVCRSGAFGDAASRIACQLEGNPYSETMLPSAPSSFCRTGSFRRASLANGLPPGYSVSLLSENGIGGVLLDTFDGHLRRSGWVLLQMKNKVALADLASGRMTEQEISGTWKFAGDLRGGPVGRLLLERSTLRAYLPFCAIELKQIKVAVRDEMEKTVVRLSATVLAKGSKRATYASAHPLRGCGEDHALLEKALLADGFTASGMVDYVRLLGMKRKPYEFKPEVVLDGNAPIFDSAGTLVRTFLGVARQNEQGIVDDLDTEFVHDYRVSLRRVRSLLSLFKGVYAGDANAKLKAELAEVMKQTNRLRDLDVCLMDKDGYYGMVPESLHEGLDVMFGVFARERRGALDGVRSLLLGPDYAQRMRRLNVPKKKGEAADEPTIHFARRLILARYNKIARIAPSIDSSTPDAQIHELRIQCKKLRYLMEFFSPLFPEASIKPLIKSLKGLQDVLGRFNDYSVQRRSLANFAEAHSVKGKKGLRLAESIDALIATLCRLQGTARGEVATGLAGVSNDRIRKQFTTLFSNEA